MSVPAFAVSIAKQAQEPSSKKGKGREISAVERCLNYEIVLSPNPHTNTLNQPISIFKSIWASTTQIANPKTHTIVLCECLAQLLISLVEEPPVPPREGEVEGYWQEALDYFTILLKDVSAFVQTRSTHNFVRTIFTLESSTRLIGAYFERWQTTVDLFQLSHQIDTENFWKNNILQAQREDELRMSRGLKELETKQDLLRTMLALNENNVDALMAAFQRRLENNISKGPEKAFYELGLRYLINSTSKRPQVDPWTITSFDVEIKGQIGSGGFGTVFEGGWKDIPVAIKILHTDKHVAPQATVVRREVETWSRLQHTHVIEFLGANILDDKPFFVMPLLKNGNAKDFIQRDTNFPRIRIVHHVALGLAYLHAQQIVHGDLKAANVLLDDNLNAVLCDFGLSRLKSDVNTRTADSSPVFMGSQNWMAPELFRGGSLRFPCDIYSLGMTIYEIFTSETPLGTVPTMEALRRLVVEEHVRPEQPEAHEAPQLTKKAWSLAKHCWHKEPTNRPTAALVCKVLEKVDDVVVPERALESIRENPSDLPQIKPRKSYHLKSVSEPIPTEGPQRTLTRRPSFFQRLLGRRAASEPAVPSIPTISHPSSSQNVTPTPIPEKRTIRQSKSMFMFRRSTREEEPIDKYDLAPLVFITPFARCMSLDHRRLTTSLSLSDGGRYLAVGLEVQHVEIWDMNSGRPYRPSVILPSTGTGRPIAQPSEFDIAAMPVNPIVVVDFQDTVSGRFWLYATAEDIVIRECLDIRRTKAKERNVARPEIPDILSVRFRGGQYCDKVAIVDVAHALKVRPTYAEKVKKQPTPQIRLSGITDADRTCFLWPRKSDSIFLGVHGGDILVFNSTNGQEICKPLAYGEGPSGRTTSGTPKNRLGTSKPERQDGLGEPLGFEPQEPYVPADCRSLAYHHETQKLIACYSSGEIRSWDLRSMNYQVLRRRQNIHGIESWLFPVAVSPQQRETVVTYPSLLVDRTLVFQDFNTGKMLGELFLPQAPWNRIQEIIISSEKKRKLIVAFEDYNSIKVWCWD